VAQDSIIDIRRFSPHPACSGPDSTPDQFVVGRASRDVPCKHAEGDPELHARLAESGCEVRIAGGSCLSEQLAAVMLLPFIAYSKLPNMPFDLAPMVNYQQSLRLLILDFRIYYSLYLNLNETISKL
jgi:hypothetical protein